jgi:hypothetical protein
VEDLHIVEFSEEVTETENGLVKDAVLITGGTHRGFEFTDEVLQDLAKSVYESGGVPLQLDHSQSVRDTVGFLESATVEDGKLIGKVRILDESTQKRVKNKLAKKLSIGFTQIEGIPKKIRELSLVAFPQVKEATLFKEAEEEKVMAEQAVNFEALQAQLEAMTEQIKSLEGKNTEFARKELEAEVVNFSEAKTIVPAQVEPLKALMVTFSEEQTVLFRNFMKNSGSIDLSESGLVETFSEEDKPETAKTEEELETEKFNAEYEAYVASIGGNKGL